MTDNLKKSIKNKKSINPSEIILQWLTYALWAWTSIMIFGLSAVTLNYHLNKDVDSGEAGAYMLASIVVLLPISILCDHYYRKHEPKKKEGPASLVMIIHTVLFVAASIISIVTAVFALVSITITGNDTTGGTITLITSLLAGILFLLLLQRVTENKKYLFFSKNYSKLIILVAIIIAIFSIIGPIKSYRETRNDRLIRQNIMIVQDKIYAYANDNDKLPQSLNDLDLRGSAKKLVDKNLIKYTANTKEPKLNDSMAVPAAGQESKSSIEIAPISGQYMSYFYTMCMTFAHDSPNIDSNYPGVVEPAVYRLDNPVSNEDNKYKTFQDYSVYKAGEKCYNNQVDVYDYKNTKL